MGDNHLNIYLQSEWENLQNIEARLNLISHGSDTTHEQDEALQEAARYVRQAKEKIERMK